MKLILPPNFYRLIPMQSKNHVTKLVPSPVFTIFLLKLFVQVNYYFLYLSAEQSLLIMNLNRIVCSNFFKIISRQSSSETIVNFNPKIELNNKTQKVESHQKNAVRQLFLII